MFLTMLLKMEYHLTISLSRVNWSSGHHLESSPVPTFLLIRISSRKEQETETHASVSTVSVLTNIYLYLHSSVELCTKINMVQFAWTVRPFVTFEWAEWAGPLHGFAASPIVFISHETGRHSIFNTTFANVINGNLIFFFAFTYDLSSLPIFGLHM